MPLELKLSSGKVFEIKHPELDDVILFGSPLKAEEEQKLLRQFTIKKQGSRGLPIEEIDHVGFGRERFKRTLKDWKGITQNGDPLDCNDENKALTYSNHSKLVTWYFEELDKAQTLEAGFASGN